MIRKTYKAVMVKQAVADGRTRDLSPQIREMIFTAHSFFVASRQLHKLSHRDDGSLDSTLMIPYHVNEAFAAELYLKVLHQLTNDKTPVKTHNLAQLFKTLPEFTQRMVLAVATLPIAEYTEREFMTALEGSSEAFASFRYFFDPQRRNPTVNYYPLDKILFAMIDVTTTIIGPLVNEIQPDFMQVRLTGGNANPVDPD